MDAGLQSMKISQAAAAAVGAGMTYFLHIWPLSDTVPLCSGSSFGAFVYIGN